MSAQGGQPPVGPPGVGPGAQPPGAQLPDIPTSGLSFMSPEEQTQNVGLASGVTPEEVRAVLLLAIKRCGENVAMPLSQTPPKEWAQAVLQMSQAYLLLDPSVDAEGLPAPPRVPMPAAAQEIAAENEGKSKTLENDRGQKPTPKPRVGA